MSCPLSVVVICRDSPDRLQALVDSLDRCEPGGDLEIVVVDDGSDRPLRPTSRRCPLTTHRREGADGSRAAARNAGARLAGGEVLLFLDADQVAPPRLVAEHLRYRAGVPQAVVVGFRRHVHPGVPGWRPEVRSRVTNALGENFAAVASAWYLTFTCNLSVDAATFAAVGGFDEGFVGWGLEDTEFGFRCWAAGVPILHNPYAYSVDHDHVVRTDAARTGQWAANLDHLRRRHQRPETDALTLLDTYPDPTAGAPGQRWSESYRRFEQTLRGLGDWPPEPPEPSGTGWPLTVLDAADAAEARRRLDRGEPLSIRDGLPGSGLDLEVQARGLRTVRYQAMVTR